MAWKMDPKFNAQYPLIGAHRGYSAKYPENTMRAYLEAVKLGVDMVEIDIAMSSDNVPVLYHDITLEGKSTPLTGKPSDYTYEELKQVRIGAKLGMEDQPLATLDEFCQAFLAYPDIVINVDMNKAEPSYIPIVMEILERYGFLDRCVFNSTNGAIIKYYHDNTNHFLVGPPDGYPHIINAYDEQMQNYHSINLPVKYLTSHYVDIVRSRNQIVMSCGLRTDEHAELSMHYGCEIALCDDPTVMLRRVGRM